ncbi:MAG: HAD family hydrolase [Chryseotalea sp.]|jgi:HAD superfamily hydrolase (TIGR01509 family)|nr:HAD family phosphatase [Flammeovirgaceae bacterium]
MNRKLNLKHTPILLFDLGGVILDLSFEKTFKAFAEISNRSLSQLETAFTTIDFFKQFETGKITEQEFRVSVNRYLQTNLSDQKLDAAWNAMLLTLPPSRLAVLKALKLKYQLYLFSNTNSIHIRYFDELVNKVSLTPFESYFNATYYSHIVGMRKPDVSTYHWICQQHTLKPEHILFFDDNLGNLQGAAKAGINTYHVTHADELFKELEFQV